MLRKWLCFLCAVGCLSLIGMPISAQEKDKKDEKKKDEKKKPPMPSQPPTHAKVAYGKHERQVLDFYQAKSDKPTPVILYIHGGGWQNGDKNSVENGVGGLKKVLDSGISVAAINYRYVKNGVEEKIQPPVKAPLEDAARALHRPSPGDLSCCGNGCAFSAPSAA